MLPVTTDCDAQGAVCTEDGRKLSEQVEVTVSGPEEQQDTATTPVTATVHNAPESHDGSVVFTFELRFSETPADGFSYTTLRDHAFTVTGGEVVKARRLEAGKNVRWEITVAPSSDADVTIALPATTDCDAQGAVCTEDGRMLSEQVELTVSGPGE